MARRPGEQMRRLGMPEMNPEPTSPTASTSTDSKRSIKIKPESSSSWAGGTDHVVHTKHPSLRDHRGMCGAGLVKAWGPNDAKGPGFGLFRPAVRLEHWNWNRVACSCRRHHVVRGHLLGRRLAAMGSV